MKKPKKRVAKKRQPWKLILYVADTSPRSILATGNLRKMCEEYLKGKCRITIVDIMKEPDRARTNDILATPTLVRVLPGPHKTVIGTLSDTDHVLRALEVRSDREDLVAMLSGATQVGHA